MAPNFYNPYQYPMQSGLRTGLDGRMVTNIEEARAAQINLDGSVWYFPSPSEGKIYTKSINMQGMPVFLEYTISNVNNPEQNVKNSIQILTKRLEELENKVNCNGHNANDENVTNIQQS